MLIGVRRSVVTSPRDLLPYELNEYNFQSLPARERPAGLKMTLLVEPGPDD